MTTAAQIRTAWGSVWSSASLTSITTRIHSFDLRAMLDQSMSHLALGMYGQEVNYFQWTVLKSFQFYAINNQAQHQYQVSIDHFRECDINGNNYNNLVDAFETLWTVIRSTIGDTWLSTVDFWQPQVEVPSIDVDSIDGKPVWRGSMNFVGIKTTSL